MVGNRYTQHIRCWLLDIETTVKDKLRYARKTSPYYFSDQGFPYQTLNFHAIMWKKQKIMWKETLIKSRDLQNAIKSVNV